VKNAMYVLESVKNVPTGTVFSFRDYCAFNAVRGLGDSELDQTLADADAGMELRFYDSTAVLSLVSSSEQTGEKFIQYQSAYATTFLFTETKNTVELTLAADPEGDKTIFDKSNDILIEVDEEDDVVNYWRKAK
jgi:hypothetical protein